MTMGKRRSPSARWTREHGNKVVHLSAWSAWRHALDMDLRKWQRVMARRVVWLPYRCRWSQWYLDGPMDTPHWHVGRQSLRSGIWARRTAEPPVRGPQQPPTPTDLPM